MEPQPKSYDPEWDIKYANGYATAYPWDTVVSFLFREKNRLIQQKDPVSVLEIGCGTGANLWCAAREGFRCFGLDASAQAIAVAEKRFASERLDARFLVGSFTQIPLGDNSIDLAIDRAALTCVGVRDAELTVHNLHRVLRPNGRFLFTPYSTAHSSFEASEKAADGTCIKILQGSLVGAGQIRFYSEESIINLFDTSRWVITEMEHVTRATLIPTSHSLHAEYKVVVQKL